MKALLQRVSEAGVSLDGEMLSAIGPGLVVLVCTDKEDTEADADFFARRRARRAVIGHDTWIGHAAMIKPEVTLGHGAVVAAGAVVTKDVPAYCIVAGTPARKLRDRQPPEIAARLLALQTTPDIGRPFDGEEGLRELVIGFGSSGYVALYRHDPADDAVYVLALRHQREAGYP